ncbi:MAG: hypothetical protein ACTS27_09280 [Phycisphaerales bacterium]
MASKTSANTGTLVFVGLLGVATVGLFVTSVVFFAKTNRLTNELAAARSDQQYVISPDQRAQYEAQLREAQSNRTTLVGLLNDRLGETMRRVTGSERTTVDQLDQRLAAFEGGDTSPALTVLQNMQSEVQSLERERDQARAAAERAQADLTNEVEARQRAQQQFEQALAAANAELDQYKAEVESYRGNMTSTISANNERVEEIRRDAADRTALLSDQNERLREQNLILQGQLDSLRAERSEDLLRPQDESTLIDGRIVSVNAASNEAFIDLTTSDRLVLGMSFEIYDNASQIRPNAEGEYPRGKATAEVIRVGDTSSVLRLIRTSRGNPVVSGDVLANAVYDPKKSYKFVVFGAFDTDRDGLATQREAENVKAIVRNWGGQVQDEIVGDTDFLVLGDRPAVPPQPPIDAPFAVVQEYTRLERASREYDRLFQVAQQTGIPVLNQNRLYTLTGLYSRR